LLMAGDGRQSVCGKKPQRCAETREQHLIARSCKFQAEVTNNRRLRLRYRTVGANY